MALQTVTLRLPAVLYDRLQRRATQRSHSVEDELLDVLATAVPVADELPTDLADALSPLALLDDEALRPLYKFQIGVAFSAALRNNSFSIFEQRISRA
ncbi:MAG: hypothetical protein M3Y74_04290 [Chloroflexota bacterium]|nr:hypothetical protein [Chloroflexota bacterium]